MRRTPHGVRGLKFVARVVFGGAADGRTPHGVRGLKWYSRGICIVRRAVAPLTGCVD